MDDKILRIGIRKPEFLPDGTATRPSRLIPGAVEFLYTIDEDGTSSKVVYVKEAVREDWKIAAENTAKEAVVWDTAKMMKSVYKQCGQEEKASRTDPSMCITNKRKLEGAGCIVSESAIRDAGIALGTSELLLVPTSIHEVMVVPDTEPFRIACRRALREMNHDKLGFAFESLGEEVVPITL